MLTIITIAASMALASYERHEVNTNTQTIVFEVKDILFDVPNFQAPPMYPFGFGAVPERLPDDDRPLKARILGLMWMEYPEARSITIHDGLVVVKLPRHEELPISLNRGVFGAYTEPAKKGKLFGDK